MSPSPPTSNERDTTKARNNDAEISMKFWINQISYTEINCMIAVMGYSSGKKKQTNEWWG